MRFDGVAFLEYLADGGEWTPCFSGKEISFGKGKSVRFAAVTRNTRLSSVRAIFSYGASHFCFVDSPDGSVAASGNIMSLLDGTLAMKSLSSMEDGGYFAFAGLFKNCKALKSAPKLPATTLADFCYNYMFHGCMSLKVAPAILAEDMSGGDNRVPSGWTVVKRG